MSKVFNSPLETSLRILLILHAYGETTKNFDSIVTADFITIYAKDFNICQFNLHGNNEFSFAEYATRRSQANHAIKSLVLDRLISVSVKEDGFHYTLTELGRDLCTSMKTDYSNSYLMIANETIKFMENKNEQQLIALIAKKATKAIERK